MTSATGAGCGGRAGSTTQPDNSTPAVIALTSISEAFAFIRFRPLMFIWDFTAFGRRIL
jgi:hypothetical protein